MNTSLSADRIAYWHEQLTEIADALHRDASAYLDTTLSPAGADGTLRVLGKSLHTTASQLTALARELHDERG